MSLFKAIHVLIRLDYLIRTSSTGTPVQLSDRLGLSERQVYRLIEDLKDTGFPICYCRNKQSYYYSKKVKIEMNIRVDEMKLL